MKLILSSPLVAYARAAASSFLRAMTDNNGLSASGSKKGKLQRIILKMLRAREHQPDGLPTNTRFIYYELVQNGIVPKPRKEGTSGRRSDQNTCEAVFWLRDKGLIPWDWIVDETRQSSRTPTRHPCSTTSRTRYRLPASISGPMSCRRRS